MNSELLKSVLEYNPDTGVFVWIKSLSNNGLIGEVAGNLGANKYRTIGIYKKKYLAHRLAWLYINGEFPKEQIDHKDHDRDNNSICNLRAVTKKENALNKTMASTNTSGVTGVYYIKESGNWQAKIQINSKQYVLGTFGTKEKAMEARKKKEIECGFHENHGA